MAEQVPLQRWKVTEPYLHLHCELGEGPYHEARHRRLRFVDIKTHRLHTLDLDLDLDLDPARPAASPPAVRTLQLDMPVGVTADIDGVDPAEKILVAGKTGLALLEREGGTYVTLARFGDDEQRDWRMRSNDGTVDAMGRFWVGTMNDFNVGEPQAEGTLFRFDADLSRHVMRTPVTIPNGIGWSLDHTTLYFTHSTDRTIYAYEYALATGALAHPRVYYRHDGPGEPDGWKMDATGAIWQAVYGEGVVLKISTRNPAQGELVGVVELPTRNITCPCFVGKELWITSAAEDEPEKYPESAKYGGALFRVHVGVTGIQEHRFRMDREIMERFGLVQR